MQVSIPELKRERVTFTIEGDSGFIVHKWADKAKNEIKDNQGGKAKHKKGIRNPEQEFRDALYVFKNNGKEQYGFPGGGFKKAGVRAANDAGMKMTDARRSFHVIGSLGNGEFVEIKGCKPTMREDMVKLAGGGVADIRYRPEFKNWYVDLDIDYNSSVISAEQIINLFQLAGFGVGVGDWRPEKNGSFGMFHVKTNGGK